MKSRALNINHPLSSAYKLPAFEALSSRLHYQMDCSGVMGLMSK